MPTSGSHDFTRTRNEIITAALRKLESVAQGQNASVSQIEEGSEALNVITKSLQNRGVRLWTVENRVQTFTASSQVTVGGNVYTCFYPHTSAATDQPGVGANWRTYWHLGGTAGAPAWVLATAYTASGVINLDDNTVGLQKVMIRDANNSDTPIEIVTYDTFFEIDDKYNLGAVPDCVAFKQDLTPRMFIYPQPNDTTYSLPYLAIRKLEDWDAAGNTPDFPERWIEFLIYELAVNLAPEYGREDKVSLLSTMAETAFKRAQYNDHEVKSNPIREPAFRGW